MTAPTLGPRFQDALLFAVRVHDGELRKGPEIPYVSHLLSVCALVLEDDGDEDEAIAALLHDTLEDHPEEVTKADLERRFGPRVADLVAACTDTPPDYRGGPKALWPCVRPPTSSGSAERGIRPAGWPWPTSSTTRDPSSSTTVAAATWSGHVSMQPKRTNSATIGLWWKPFARRGRQSTSSMNWILW